MSDTNPQKPAIRLIDSHAHLDMPRFDADREEVINRAGYTGVTGIINVGIDLASSQKAIALAQSHPGVLAAVGIHPQEARDITPKDIAGLSELSRRSKVVAIGEIGLDFYRDYAPHQQQIQVLEWQLALASESGLPAVIHCRQAEKETPGILRDWTNKRPASAAPPGVIHCFSGSLELAQTYLALGFYISLGAYIGYPSSRKFRDVIKRLPLDRLLIETDCPFLPPRSRRGQRNEPAYVVETAKELAGIKGLTLQEIAEKTTQNTARLFRI